MNRSVLVAESSSLVRKVVGDKLESIGLSVTSVASGDQAFRLAQSAQFSLIISGIELEGMGGLELCRRIKSDRDQEKTPVIMLSSNLKDSTIEAGFEAGAAAFIPVTDALESLVPRVREILDSCYGLRHEKEILVADDSSLIRDMVSSHLRSLGYRIHTVENGQQACNFLQNKQVDLILSDINMPELNGILFFDKIKSDPELRSIPFVFMSVERDYQYMRDALMRGASAYIVKPFEMDQLAIIVDKLLSDYFLQMIKEKERLEQENLQFVGSLNAIARALDERDPYTLAHSKEVVKLVKGMAQVMDLSSEERDQLITASRMHNLGMISVSPEIFMKREPLTDKELQLLRMHPVTGANLLRPIERYHDIVPAVLHHHEHYDGSGYPDGLSGEDIPLFARMIAVADIYAAMVAERPYHEPKSSDEAIAEMKSMVGTHLCPSVFQAFAYTMGFSL